MTHHADADFIALQSALAGEYSLDCEIGRGGMGIVYRAREARLARQVAIKVLLPALADRADLRAEFLREAQTVAQLNHPNIVPVHAAGERGGFVYIVMAYVEGITLAERVRTRGPLQPGQAARMMREVAWALGYAHGAGMVHRDVSADNILLERGTDRAIVMDFGIARAMQTAAVTDDGRVMGNAHFISPEQAVGEPVDGRSDLYSLGVCGFLALTGHLPFNGATPAAIVNAHLTSPAPSIASAVSIVPPRLAAAVEKCLAKDPILRYRNAESFAEAIDLAFEHAREIPTALRVWNAMATLGAGGAAFTRTLIVVSTFAVVSTVALAGRFLKSRLASPLARLKVAFWKGGLGARLAKVAAVGLPPVARAALGSRQLTEVALGRATDHLFRALPAAVRRELADLPDIVARLEHDATALRASIDSLDAQIALFERTRGRNAEASRSNEAEEDLCTARTTGIERLSATIAALENIRLDLLRLQMGSAGVESISASLEAAQRVSARIAHAIEAQEEVEQWLRDEPRLTLVPSEPQHDIADDANTPADGVPATSR